MTKKSELGQLGEDIACEYLKDKGFKIIERNFRRPWGELDIIAKAPDRTLVFIEVKTMRPGTLKPEDQMTANKIIKFKRAASLYAGHNHELINEKKGWRLDLLAITVPDYPLTICLENCDIKHYENV